MSYYNELNELYMEKVAARSYGRNPDGSRRSATQLIEQLGGAKPLKNDKPKSPDFYWDGIKENRHKKIPQKYITGNGKYNFTYDESNNPNRINLGRELLRSKKYPEKSVRQHTIYVNRLSGDRYEGKTDRHLKQLRKMNEDRDVKEVFSGRHPRPRVFGDMAKENVKKNKEIVKDMVKKGKKRYSSKAPYAILAAGLLTAGAAETKNLYDKIKAKREAENKDKAKKTELLNA